MDDRADCAARRPIAHWVLAAATLWGCGDAMPTPEPTVPAVAESLGDTPDKADDAAAADSALGTPLTCSAPSNGFDPNGVHDLGDGPQFEGWYYRVTPPATPDAAPGTRESWVLIVAYWVDRHGDRRAFVELVEGPSGRTLKRVYEDVDLDAIQDGQGIFALSVGDLFFTADTVIGRFESEGGEVVELDWDLDACARWGAPDDDRNRWTMGWVTEAPGVPLRWHVHHLKGEARGTVRIDGAARTFDGAALHQEKNWGRAFPSRWIWLQANDFEDRPDVALAAAGGPIFAPSWSPSGYMLGLRWRDRFFTFRTQDTHQFPLARFEIDEENGLARWSLDAENLRHRVEIRAHADAGALIPIDVPADGGLAVGAVEHLAATVDVTLYARDGLGWRLLGTARTHTAAVEAGGEFARAEGLIP